MLLEGHASVFGINSFSKTIRRTMAFRRTAYVSAGLLSLLILLTLCPVYLVPPVTEAATKDANPATLTYNATSSAASVSLTVSDNAGVFASSGSNELASFGISTNNATGYTLNLKVDGTGDTTSLSDGTNTIASITNTSGITASNFSNNTWGLLPSKYNGTANAGDNPNYYPASTTGFKMDETSAANTTANTYTVGLGIKVNHNTPAGTYTNTAVVAEYVANAVTYSINYYTNTNDTVTGMPSINPQTGTVAQGTTSTSVTLASAPSRTGYTFVGWCKGSDASTSNITVKTDGTPDVCANSSTNQFTAGQSFGIDATISSNTYYLFAMWQRNSYTCTKQYRLENADGTWGSYTGDGTEQILYGDTCNYSKTVTNYKNSASGTNNSTASTSGTMGVDGLTLSLSLYRNTFTCKISYKLENADGSFGSTTVAVNETKRYGQACSWSRNADTTHQAANYTNNSITSNVDTTVSVMRKTFTITKQYRLQDTSGNYPSSYTADGTATVRYGASYTYSRSATTTHQAASTSASNVTSSQTLSLSVPRVLVACNRRYRLQNADGSYPSGYTSDGSVNAYYGGSCSYSKTVTDYNNNTAKSTSASNVTSTQTLSLDFPRNTYALTVSAGTNTSSPTGSGTYRWGQTVAVGVTKASNTTCATYATPTWTQSGTTGTFSSTSGASVNFTMGKGAATVTASSSASNVSQTITLSRTGSGANGITIAGTKYTGSSVSLTCGTYNISGNYDSGYGFSSWSRANGVAVASTSTASTTMTVTGAGTLTLTGKANKYTCTKQYRLQNADGTYPSTWTSGGTEQVDYNTSCSYSQSYTDYTAKSGTCTVTTSGCTVQLSLPRNTYALTVSAGTNTSSATGSGTYRWGQTVAVGVTKATNVTCTTYATPTWTATAGTAPSAGASSSYTMPKSAATVTATSTASNVAQTITLSKGTGVSGITIGGTNYTGASASLTCGTYSISGNYSSGYEFSSWAVSGSLALGSSTTTASNTITVSGSGTLSLAGKPYPIVTFITNNASNIVFNGVTYTNNQTVAIPSGTYPIYGNYNTRYGFLSWSATTGSFENINYQVTKFTVSGNTTITLTGQSVGTTIQSIIITSCTTTAKPVYDSRDNEVYWIQKLADGKCWMLDNLRLGSTSSISLTKSNSNISGTRWTLPQSGTDCFSTSSCTGSDGSTTGTGYTVPAINTSKKDIIPISRYSKVGGELQTLGPGTGRAGVYYNYCAATAGTICSSSNSDNASYDICPFGWKMPTNSQYSSLRNKYDGIYDFRTALSVSISGYFINGVGDDRLFGLETHYWSSTKSGTTKVSGLLYNIGDPTTIFGTTFRYYGGTVRCVLK